MVVTNLKGKRPLKKKSQKRVGTARVYLEIRNRILELQYAPGADLDEAALEKVLGVSRTPVREALIRLASEGLVVQSPNRCAHVAPIGIATIRQYFEALDLCQRAVTRWAALRHRPEDMALIEKKHLEFKGAAATGDVKRMLEANQEFHMAIAASCENAYLAQTYGRLFAEGQRLARLTLAYSPRFGIDPSEHLEKVINEHQAMVDAITVRDADRAEELGRAHTVLFRSRINEYLNQNLAGDLDILPVYATPAPTSTPLPAACQEPGYRISKDSS